MSRDPVKRDAGKPHPGKPSPGRPNPGKSASRAPAGRPVKTSETHPLPIAVVPTPGGGVIGLAMAPGKRQPDAITGPWERDIDADFTAIVEFGAHAVVTLMETSELTGVAIPADKVRAAAAQRGIGWVHWPIVDFAAPDATFEAAWAREAAAVCDQLAGGGRVLVHCRGGRGRSGLVAARLLIELGVSNADAFAAVRAAQPLAMETTVQEDHVRGYKPVLGLKRG